jgi:hypothetical protein
MMVDRETLLSRLVVGDVFHAESPRGASLICLAVSIDEASIRARRVTTQEDVEFDRHTGVEKCIDRRVSKINSVAPLPVDVLNVILAIDRKYRLQQDLDEGKLTQAEIKALTYAGAHYALYPV